MTNPGKLVFLPVLMLAVLTAGCHKNDSDQVNAAENGNLAPVSDTGGAAPVNESAAPASAPVYSAPAPRANPAPTYPAQSPQQYPQQEQQPEQRSKSSNRSKSSRPNISSRNIRINKTRAIRIRVTRTRLPSTLPSLLRRCRSINSRHAPNQTTCGRRATGPTLRLATIGFLECGPSLPMLGRSGLRDTGITIRAATDSTKAIGDVTSATTAE